MRRGRSKGVEVLGDTYEITVEDLEGALKKQNVTQQPGDAVIITTVWDKLTYEGLIVSAAASSSMVP